MGKTKGTTKERGYGSPHQRLRRQWAAKVATGSVACWRCGELIRPGEPWDLGHDDFDRTLYRGPEHRSANRAAGARKANAKRRRPSPLYHRYIDVTTLRF